MHQEAKPLPHAADLWEWYSFNPLTGALYSRRRTSAKPVGKTVKGYLAIHGVGYAHRTVWKWVTGEDPAGMIDHINRQRKDNRFSNLRVADMQTQSMNRDKQKLTKLSPDDVREIRTLVGTMPQWQIAERYGVSQSQISCVKNGVTHYQT